MLAFTVLSGLAFASSASAALTQTPFGCRASDVRATIGSNGTIEPYVANPKGTPCATDSQGVGAASLPTTSSVTLYGGPVGAFTDSVFDPSGATAPGAAAVVSVQGISIPTPSGIIHIVGPVQASATYACVNNQLVADGRSSLDVIEVNGVRTPVPPGKETIISLGGTNYLAINQKIVTSSSLTEVILHVHLTGVADIVVGEAMVTQSKVNPCAGTSGQPPVLEICPKGSTLDVVRQRCVIKACGGTIVVSRPFQGPSGGTVVALCVARKKYKSPCLNGPGPKFALVATKVGGRVEGTLYSDRILALGSYERVAGLGGNDCIDGSKAGHQKLYDGNGKDRVYGGKVRTRIAVGSGNDLVEGGSGSDTITAANGNSRIYGNGGNDFIEAGLGRTHIYGGAGRNRIFVPGANAIVNCGPAGHNTAFLRRKAIPYAAAHGCNRIIHLN